MTNRLPAKRRCLADLLLPCKWEEETGLSHFSTEWNEKRQEFALLPLPPIIKSIYYRITFTKIIHYIAKVKRLANYYFFSMFAFSNP